MNEKAKRLVKGFCKLLLQALLILLAIFVGLYIFSGLVIFGALSQS